MPDVIGAQCVRAAVVGCANRPARPSTPAQRQGDFAHAANPSDRLLPESILDFVVIAAPVSRQHTVLPISRHHHIMAREPDRVRKIALDGVSC